MNTDTDKKILHLLTSDFIQRKEQKFPLLTSPNLFDYICREQEKEINIGFMTYGVKRTSPINRDKENFDSLCKKENGKYINRKLFYNEAYHDYSASIDFVRLYSDCLVIAGGAAFQLLARQTFLPELDVDFFFYGITPQKCEEIILHAIKFLKNYPLTDVEGYRNKETQITVTRNKNAVTIVLSTVNYYAGETPYLNDILKFQFILRIYPSIDLIVGGFDITIAAIACDGYKFYATEIAAWSVAHMINIVDISRASTSFSNRLKKYTNYARGAKLVFPGVRQKDVKTDVVVKQYRDFIYLLKRFCIQHDYEYTEFDFVKYEDNYFENYEEAFSKQFKPLAPELIVEKFEERLEEFVRKYPDYDSKKYPNAAKMFFTNTPISKNLFEEKLKKFCSEHGYVLLNECERGSWECESSFIPKTESIPLFDNVRCEPGMKYNIWSTSNKNGLEHEKQTRKESDYGDNYIHTKCLEKIHVQQLIKDKFDFVKCYFEFTCDQTDEEVDMMWKENLSNPFIGNLVEKLYEEFEEFSIESAYLAEFSDIWSYRTVGERKEIREILTERLEGNMKMVQKELVGLEFMTTNPWRQWTSSFNPRIENPREWYKQPYTPVYAGVPKEIETCLRLIWRFGRSNDCSSEIVKSENHWKNINRDAFNLIMKILCMIWNL